MTERTSKMEDEIDSDSDDINVSGDIDSEDMSDEDGGPSKDKSKDSKLKNIDAISDHSKNSKSIKMEIKEMHKADEYQMELASHIDSLEEA